MYSCSRFHNIHNLFNYIRHTHFSFCKESFVGKGIHQYLPSLGEVYPKTLVLEAPRSTLGNNSPFPPSITLE